MKGSREITTYITLIISGPLASNVRLRIHPLYKLVPPLPHPHSQILFIACLNKEQIATPVHVIRSQSRRVVHYFPVSKDFFPINEDFSLLSIHKLRERPCVLVKSVIVDIVKAGSGTYLAVT